MNNPYVKLIVENGVGYITFFHPNRNSMPSDILILLEKAILEAGNHEDVTVIVLKSGGDRTFCAGASFNEVVTIQDEK